MARGFVSGVVWGLVVSGAGVAGASLLAGDGSRVVLAPMSEPEKPVVEAPAVAPEVAQPETSAPTVDTPDAVAEPQAEPEATTVDPVIAPEPETPAEEPQTAPVDTTQNEASDGASDATMNDPQQAPAADPVDEAEPAAPVEEQAEVAAPQTPIVEAEETVEPVTSEVTTRAVPEAVEPEVSEMAQPVETPASEDPAPAPEMSEAMAEDSAAEVVTPQEDPAPEVVEEDVVEPATPETQTAEPRIAALPQITAPEPSDEAATEPQAETPEADAAPEAETTGANISRLPTIGGTTEPESDTPVTGDQAEADQTTDGALNSYAMSFDNPDAKPMLSVVLIDDPDAPVSDDALAHLPFPLSFAIDATRDDASKTAARYRAAGFEVLLVTNLPKGASASDVAVAFEAYMNAIPEAVAVLDRDATSAEAQQIAGILADRGFGLVTPSKGLNSAQKAAQREGVPAALIYRELDAGNEEVPAIRQYLDRAAFRAVQEGSVIMLGSTRPETIEALVLWALEDRAASVAIAPVSAVLKGG
ncbi:divergent polysaccharide deacetylase family protein [Profundibacter amoris]|uniref:Polysaccharide deacteylase family 2 protein n=1 Tax=Profundibacter amoris TaxID=2171755 RepID=A0A347UH81_9RHOB|nr:divergent polysaccharide deacetylase family protein [Profundibacter amoris]AXX98209.1 polysaccharide deacteylase family 2 protein [Profundibacter amoris]